jgi:probable phosphoglycerate mutase
VPDPGPEVTLVRHGETEWSKSGQHTGRTDLPLTEEGVEEARAAGQVLKGTVFDLVLTSPLRRARETAELAGLSGATVDGDLREWDYGEFEGLTTPQINERYPDWTIWTGPWPGGETSDQIGARADRAIARCLELAPGTKVAVVAHGHFLRVFGARWLGAPVIAGRWLPLSTAAICRLGWEHDWRALRTWNLTPPGLSASGWGTMGE